MLQPSFSSSSLVQQQKALVPVLKQINMAKIFWVVEPSFLLIMFSILFIICNEMVTAYGESNIMKLEIEPTKLEHMLHRDTIRQRAISHKVVLIQQQQQHKVRLPSIANIKRKVLGETDGANNDLNVSTKMPMHSGADLGIGQYLVGFEAGTPSQKFMLVADTGSDLTWMNCKYGCTHNPNKCSSTSSRTEVFEADNSSSFATIPCSSDMCKIQLANLFSLTLCPSPLTPCSYDYRYSDGSSAIGFFANETVTVGLTNGRNMKLHNVLIGCSESSRGPSFQQHEAADGVLGLGYSKASFAIKATQEFGGKFSYCLVDHLSPQNVSNYLTFGSACNNSTSLQYTNLGAISSFYAVNIMGISIGGVMLKIPGEIWDVNGVGGAIIDSGTSLTYLTLPAYHPVVAALKASLTKFHQLNLQIGPLQYCFNSTGFNECLDVPKLSFHFDDGARFEPPVKSYVIDAAEGVKCLGFVPTAWPGVSVIGNIMQQNHLWEFDLIRGKLGFSPSSCT